jgi:two-component system response regulator VicR
MAKRILIVEDDENIVEVLGFNLEREGYEVVKAYDGREGLEAALHKSPDLILLDVMLPYMDGFEVCREIRKIDGLIPIIMLTAREEEQDKVLGLELGADDYITKPFKNKELFARIKTNMRRAAVIGNGDNAGGSELIKAGSIWVDTGRMTVTKKGVPVELTQREYELIKFLAASVGRVFTREELMAGVWNYDYFGSPRSIDVTITRLRAKLEDEPANPVYLCTRRGGGYYLSGE